MEFISESFPYPVTDPKNPLLYKPRPLFLKELGYWLVTHPDQIYQEIILSIILRRARLRYCKPRQRIISSNLLPATNDLNAFTVDLENQIVQS